MIGRECLVALELERVVRHASERCSTPLGEERAAAVAPLASSAQAMAEARSVDEYARLLEQGLDLDLGRVGDVRPALLALAKDGLVLAPEDFARLRRLILACFEAAKLLGASEPCRELAARVPRLPALPGLEQAVARTIDEEGRIRDQASPLLAEVRGRLRAAREHVDRAVERFFESHPHLGERIVTVRDDRAVVAVRSDLGPSRLGIVHGRSSSGATLYVEPFVLVPVNNQAIDLRDRERHEEERVLRALTQRLSAARPDLEAAAAFVGDVDWVRARARLARALGAVLAEASADGAIELEAARHPLLVLEQAAGAEGAPVIPLSLRLAAGETLVITGPNTGGKTVALKTVGLSVLLFCCGLPVSARRARLPFLSSLFVDIGDPQDLRQSLSTFSGHMRRVAGALAALELPSLVLLDELGAGTDPREGAALGVAVVDRLRHLGASAVVTSHHEALKRYSLSTSGVRSAAVEFDEATLLPTYRLLVDRTGNSNALLIAERLGLPAEVIAHARALLEGSRGADERLLEDLESAARAHDRAREQAERDRSDLAMERERLALRDAELASRERALAERETTIGRKLKADFEHRCVRALEELRARGEVILAETEQGLRRRLEEKVVVRLAAEAASVARAAALDPPGMAIAREPAVGDRVRVAGFGVIGEVLGRDGRQAEVAVAGKRLRVALGSLELLPGRVGGGVRDVHVAVPESDAAPAELNLIGHRVDDALSEVDRFLDRAVRAHLDEVRIIHGHGSGRLRAGIRQHLRLHPSVRAIESDSGGGMTRAMLDL